MVRRERPTSRIARLADAHVDPRSVAGQHSGDMQRQGRAIAQESTDPLGPVGELLGRGHHDQLATSSARGRLVLEIAPCDGDQRVGLVGAVISRGRLWVVGGAGRRRIPRGRLRHVDRRSQDERVFGPDLSDDSHHSVRRVGEAGESARRLAAALLGIRVSSDSPQSSDDFVELAGGRGFGHVDQGLLGGRRGGAGERANLRIGQLPGRECLIDQGQFAERPGDTDMLAGCLVAGARPPREPRDHRDAARVCPTIAGVEFTDSTEPCVLDRVDAAGEFGDLLGEVLDGFQTIGHPMIDDIETRECQVESTMGGWPIALTRPHDHGSAFGMSRGPSLH
ncbi:hypothetical protein ACNOYE_32495 [Nannocystaceae bacterium ST9]